MKILVDTNVLLRSVDTESLTHHAAVEATKILLLRGDRLVITPQNEVEFWSVATRPSKVNGLNMDHAEVERSLRKFEAEFAVVPDSPDIHQEWRRLVISHSVSGRQVHDARLVAAMRVDGITHILTFNDRDFQRYSGITALNPGDVVTSA